MALGNESVVDRAEFHRPASTFTFRMDSQGAVRRGEARSSRLARRPRRLRWAALGLTGSIEQEVRALLFDAAQIANEESQVTVSPQSSER